jgi:hypothetical protein
MRSAAAAQRVEQLTRLEAAEVHRAAATVRLPVVRDPVGRAMILAGQITRGRYEIWIGIGRTMRGRALLTMSSVYPLPGGGFAQDRRGCCSLMPEDVQDVCKSLQTARAIIAQLGWPLTDNDALESLVKRR